MEEEEKLLEKFIDGYCTGEELREVHLLLKDKAGREMLDALIEKREAFEWNNPPEMGKAMQELVQTRQIEMQQRIADHESRRSFFHNKLIRWGSYAAVFLGVFVMTTLIWQHFPNRSVGSTEPQYVEISNSGGLPKLHLLPDSTKVYLAGGSTVKYPKTFHKSERNIELQGEAFFEVKRDETRPFTIHSGSMKTKVLGTSFKVTAFEGLEQEVAVASGKVSISAVSKGKTSEMALLTRGLKIRYNPQTGEHIKGEVDAYSLEKWKTGTLLFNEEPMSFVAQQLESRYGIQLEFADREVAKYRVSGTFAPEETATEILGMLGFVGKFRHESVDGRHFTIYLSKQ